MTRVLIIAMAGLGAALALQTWRLNTEVASHAETRSQAAQERAAYAEEVAAAERAYAAAVWQAREREQELIAHAAEIQETKDAQIRTATARADDLRRRLRNAEAAALAADAAETGAAPAVAAPEAFAPGTLGAVIHGQARDLVDEALRADVIRLNLVQCYQMYESARGVVISQPLREQESP